MKAFFFSIGLLSIGLHVDAQINSFTQIINTNIALNPASAGIGGHALRAVAINSPFSVYGREGVPNIFTSIDGKLLRLSKHISLSGGLLFELRDPLKAEDKLQINRTGMCVAIANTFGKKYKQYLSIGSTAAFKQLVLTQAWAPKYEEQFFDVDLGLQYGITINPRTNISAAVALQNIFPADAISNFVPGKYAFDITHQRFNAQLQVRHQWTDKISMQSSLLYQSNKLQNAESSISQLEYGSIFDIALAKKGAKQANKNIVQVGAYYRFLDAIAPYIGFRKKSHQIGLSYDISMSPFSVPLRQLPQSNLELSYVYLLQGKR
ncbi:MAG: hypothetical protein RL660_1019 [Bacteroidota bacterium]|jgi:hypothetical protein